MTISPNRVSLSRNPIYVEFLSNGHTALDNYRVVVLLLFEGSYNSNTYAPVVEVEIIPSSDGLSKLDISHVLHTAIEHSSQLQVPELSSPAPYRLDTLRRYRLQYFEKYGTPQSMQPAVTSPTFRVLMGGIDAYNFSIDDFFSTVSASSSLLTQFPSGKAISRSQPEYIAHIRSVSLLGYHAFLRVRQFNDSGTLISQVDKYRLGLGYADPILLVQDEAATFPVGPTELELDAAAVKYTVQVFAIATADVPGSGLTETGSATTASEVFSYFIDDRAQFDYQDIIWFNSFRAPHILRCTGRKETAINVERLLSEVAANRNYSPVHVGTFQHGMKWGQTFTYRSGSLKPEEKDAIQELLIENLLLEHRSGKYHRLLIRQERFPVLENGVSPNYLEFQAERSLSPINYQRQPTVAIGEPAAVSLFKKNDGGYWLLNSGGRWKLNN